ncbi:MAG: hypothetical protein AB2606_14585 [Candidatus Thiodiazotropha taylori]
MKNTLQIKMISNPAFTSDNRPGAEVIVAVFKLDGEEASFGKDYQGTKVPGIKITAW